MGYLTEHFVWALVVFGSVNIFVVSSLMRPLRDWLKFSYRTYKENGVLESAVERRFKLPGKLISCPMCLGFWSGIFWGVVVWSPANNVITHTSVYNPLWEHLFNGFLGSIESWMLYLYIADKQFKH